MDADAIAQAICNRDGDVSWYYLSEANRQLYRDMARAAINALQLTEETRRLEDGYGGALTDMKTGETRVEMRAATRQRRLVGPWVCVEEVDP